MAPIVVADAFDDEELDFWSWRSGSAWRHAHHGKAEEENGGRFHLSAAFAGAP